MSILKPPSRYICSRTYIQKANKLAETAYNLIKYLYNTTMSATMSTSMSATIDHVHLHVGHKVSHHVGHHNIIATLCEG